LVPTFGQNHAIRYDFDCASSQLRQDTVALFDWGGTVEVLCQHAGATELISQVDGMRHVYRERHCWAALA
jgi:hypothetical protein